MTRPYGDLERLAAEAAAFRESGPKHLRGYHPASVAALAKSRKLRSKATPRKRARPVSAERWPPGCDW